MKKNSYSKPEIELIKYSSVEDLIRASQGEENEPDLHTPDEYNYQH